MPPTTPTTAARPLLAGIGLMTSRKEDALRYVRTLEQEFLTCELRSQIYTRPTDRDYYLRVMDLKRANIERVASREGLPHLFNSAEVETAARARFAGPGGLPNFYYKDYTDRGKFRDSDLRNYYQPGRRVVLEGGQKGRCAGLCDDGARVRVRLEGHSRKAPTKVCAFEQVTRVFTPVAETTVALDVHLELVADGQGELAVVKR